MISKLKLKLLGIIIFILTILNNYLISNYNKEVFKMATKKTIKAATIKETKNLSTPTPVTNTNFDWKNFTVSLCELGATSSSKEISNYLGKKGINVSSQSVAAVKASYTKSLNQAQA